MSRPEYKTTFERALESFRTGDGQTAASLCREALARRPDDVDFLTLLGAAQLAQRHYQDALATLRHAVELAPDFPRAHEYLGQALLAHGERDEALRHLRRAVELEPESEALRLKLAHTLARSGQVEEADALYEQSLARSPQRKALASAGEHLRAGRTRECERICRAVLGVCPDEVNAMRLLARVAMEMERWGHAERLLRRALKLAPDFHGARLDLARVLRQQDRIEDAIACTTEAIALTPRSAGTHYLHAGMLAIAARYEASIAAYRRALELQAHNPPAWVGLGHVLKTIGRQQEGIEAYRNAIAQQPGFGEVYWSLANLKTFRFGDDEIVDMERRLADESLDVDARVHFLFTLGKSREDQGEHARAFEHYAAGAALQRMRIAHDPVETELINGRIRTVFSASFLAERAGQGCPEPAPIFIVGLPRSGSTLIEQILASHSQVEGTAELPDVGRVVTSLGTRWPGTVYPEAVQRLDAQGLAALGEKYLETTARHRHGLPHFTDKMPNNFPSIGLIHLMLPNATVIDARRHPLDSCFGSFKQHFATGQSWSYDLLEIGEFYLEYRRMLRHWHEVLPGRVLELRYEDLVRDQENRTRALLAHCNLAFEEQCLRFHETERAVRTASSEQVRQPLYDTSINHWRHFRAQLAPLIEVLGDELEGWDA